MAELAERAGLAELMGEESARVGELRTILLVEEGRPMPWTDTDVAALAAYCRLVLPLAEILPEPSYHSLPLCVLDAVFSIGVRYESVQHVLQRYADHCRIPLLADAAPAVPEVSLTVFLADYAAHGSTGMAERVLCNRQRTSPRNGILKAEAARQFAVILRDADLETMAAGQRRCSALLAAPLYQALTAVPGQGSGLSVRYLALLLGDEDGVKPDRMLHRFVFAGTGHTMSNDELVGLFQAAARQLCVDFPQVTPARLDRCAWAYQRRHPLMKY